MLDQRRQTTVLAVAGVPGAAAAAALLLIGQLWIARELEVLEPAQEWYGPARGERWPFQLFLMAWYTTAAAVAAAALAWTLMGSRIAPAARSLALSPGVSLAAPWWPWLARLAVTAAATVSAAGVGLPVLRAWSAAAGGVDDPAGEATRAVLIGLLVGFIGAFLSTVSRAVRRCTLAWIGWTWVALALMWVLTLLIPEHCCYYYPASGLLPQPRFAGDLVGYLNLLGVLMVIAALAAWAAHRGDWLPVLGAIHGVLLQVPIAAILVLYYGGTVYYSTEAELFSSVTIAVGGGILGAFVVGGMHLRRFLRERRRS